MAKRTRKQWHPAADGFHRTEGAGLWIEGNRLTLIESGQMLFCELPPHLRLYEGPQENPWEKETKVNTNGNTAQK